MSNEYPSASFLIGLACKAGLIIKNNFTLGMERVIKEDGSPVTETDQKVNRLVVDAIRRGYPHVRILGEEENVDVAGAEYALYFDPLSGTIPFSRGIPTWTFAAAVMRGNEPQVAVIYDPHLGRIWAATKGVGAHLLVGAEKYPAKVSKHSTLAGAHVGFSWKHDSCYHMDRVCQKLVTARAEVSMLRSITYYGGLIASGAVEATVFPSKSGLETAAMQLIVSEAGGKVTNIYGHPMRYGPKGEIHGHIISNGLVHDELRDLVLSCQPADR